MCIDALEDLWRNCTSASNLTVHTERVLTSVDDDARIPTKKLLAKWRPQVLEDGNTNMTQQEVKEETKSNAQASALQSSASEDAPPPKAEATPNTVAAVG